MVYILYKTNRNCNLCLKLFVSFNMNLRSKHDNQYEMYVRESMISIYCLSISFILLTNVAAWFQLKGTQLYFLNSYYCSGSEPCGGRKKTPRTSFIVQIIHLCWLFQNREGILRKNIMSQHSFSKRIQNIGNPFSLNIIYLINSTIQYNTIQYEYTQKAYKLGSGKKPISIYPSL